jgi:hypothetical protein
MAKKEVTKERVRAVIAEIVDIMSASEYSPLLSGPSNDDDRLADNLWSILTALRGPDTQNRLLKDLTTARVRSAIGLEPNWLFTVSLPKDTLLSVTKISDVFPYILNREYGHFISHYNAAYGALRNLGYLNDETNEKV